MTKLVRDLMQPDVITVTPDTGMTELQRLFLSARVGALPVVDREDRLLGITSRSDVVRKFSLEQSLAELTEIGFDPIAGDEDDEHDATALESIGAAVGRRISHMRARDVMITEVTTIGPDEPIEEAANLMLKHRVHRLPVIEGDRLIGIISTFDFMSLYVTDPASRP